MYILYAYIHFDIIADDFSDCRNNRKVLKAFSEILILIVITYSISIINEKKKQCPQFQDAYRVAVSVCMI